MALLLVVFAAITAFAVTGQLNRSLFLNSSTIALKGYLAAVVQLFSTAFIAGVLFYAWASLIYKPMMNQNNSWTIAIFPAAAAFITAISSIFIVRSNGPAKKKKYIIFATVLNAIQASIVLLFLLTPRF